MAIVKAPSALSTELLAELSSLQPNEKDHHGRSAAVAIAYRTGQTAPQIVAKGRGPIAEAIIARAKESGVFVHESPQLVSLLMQVDLDQYIPPQLYVAIAELLVWIYRIEERVVDAVGNAPKQVQRPTKIS